MSEEEAILYLEHTAEDDFNLEEHQRHNRYLAIKTILDLYNKEKEKNKELYKDNQKQWEERCKLAIELDNNTISKDKVKEIKNIADKDNCYQYVIFYKKICELLEK